MGRLELLRQQRTLLNVRRHSKRYVAWLDGIVAADRGSVTLPLRGDVDDRPRQIHDPLHVKRALTEWRVLARELLHAEALDLVHPQTGQRLHLERPAPF